MKWKNGNIKKYRDIDTKILINFSMEISRKLRQFKCVLRDAYVWEPKQSSAIDSIATITAV